MSSVTFCRIISDLCGDAAAGAAQTLRFGEATMLGRRHTWALDVGDGDDGASEKKTETWRRENGRQNHKIGDSSSNNSKVLELESVIEVRALKQYVFPSSSSSTLPASPLSPLEPEP